MPTTDLPEDHLCPCTAWRNVYAPQVYDGSRAWWKEEDDCRPVNVYGQTKLEGERAIQVRGCLMLAPQAS